MKATVPNVGSPRHSPAVSRREVEQRYFGLMQISGEAVLIICSGLIVFANEPACELLGMSATCELRGVPYLDFIAPSQHAAVRARLRALKVSGQISSFVRRDLLRADRRPAHVEVAMHACSYGGRPAVQILMRDLSEQRRLQAELMHLAGFDPLTELSNRSGFIDSLDAALDEARRDDTTLGVVCVSLDNFRAVNDIGGQHGGDVLLSQMGERLRRAASAGATLARLGGDQFGIVLERIGDAEAAAAAARRLMESFTDCFLVDGTEYFASVSLGIAMFPQHAQRRDRLLHKAMLAMKFAKSHGGNQFHLYSDELTKLDLGAAKRRAETVLHLKGLTHREREVLDLLVTGKANKMIAYLLGISARTIEIHRRRVMDKMEAESLADLVHMTLELH